MNTETPWCVHTRTQDVLSEISTLLECTTNTPNQGVSTSRDRGTVQYQGSMEEQKLVKTT